MGKPDFVVVAERAHQLFEAPARHGHPFDDAFKKDLVRVGETAALFVAVTRGARNEVKGIGERGVCLRLAVPLYIQNVSHAALLNI